MKRKQKCSLLLVFAMVVSLFSGMGTVKAEAATPTWIETYKKASYEMTSPNFTMKVGGTPVEVVHYFYKKDVREGYSYAHFAYEGTATFEITSLKGNIESVDASPHSYNMDVKISGNKFTFDLTQKKSRYMVFDVRANGGSYQLIVSADPKLDLTVPVVDGKTVIDATQGMAEIGVGGLNSSGNAASGKSNTEKIQKIITQLSKNGGGTLYFPAGVYPFVTIDATSNVTLYLDAEAVLRGSGIRTDYDWNTTGSNGIQAKKRDVRIENVQNFKIIGKGMVDANSIAVSQKGKTTKGSRELNNDPQPDNWYPDGWNDYRKGIVEGDNSDGIEFKGVTFKDATGWTFNIRNSRNIEMNNVKMLDDYTVVHSDGYDIVSCQNVNVQNCFGVCGDDVFCPKGDITGVDMKNYLFKDCVAYAEGGAGCKIGVQARSNVSNIEFNNIDVIRGYRGFSIAHDEGNGNWENIRFIDIRTEKLHIPSFSTTDADNYGQYTATPFTLWLLSNGSVKNVEVTNCSFESISNMRAMIKGKSDNGKISNVTFNNLTMDGRTVTSLDDPRLSVGSYVDKGSFKFNDEEVYKPTTKVYEAEKAQLANGAKTSAEDKAGKYSGANKVSHLGYGDGKEGTATFTVNVDKAGEYEVEVYAITKGARAFYITVNNGTPQVIHCNGDGWTLQGRKTTKLQLKAGNNTIKFGNPNGAAPDLDKIEIITGGSIYDANSVVNIEEEQPVSLSVPKELMTLANGARLNNSGLIGYVGGPDDGTVTFHVQAEKEGNHLLRLYYASAQDRDVSVTVNNNNPVTATCTSNGGWDTAGTMPKEMTVKLNKGDNTITIRGVNGGDAPNIDRIAVSFTEEDAQLTVAGWIDAIPENVTAEDKAYINAVNQMYESLDNKSNVNTSKLTAAMDAIETIEKEEAQAAENQKAADAVEELISKIQTVTLDSEDRIKEAREAYDALTAEQKKLVENIEILTSAEEKLDELKTENEKPSEDTEVTEPTKPSETEPTKPSESEPTEPTKPSETEPTEPTKPSESEPTEPTDSSETEPTEPTEPTKPSETEPTEPTKPSGSEPTEPTKPSESEPTEPTKPSGSEPTEPTEPGANNNQNTQTPGGDNNQNQQSNTQPPVTEQPADVSKGDVYWYKNLKYKVTKTSATGKGAVELVSTKNKKITAVNIPAYIKIEGKKYNVTSIGKNAFKNCKKLKKIVIKTVQLKKVGKNAFRGIKSNATIKVPSSRLKKYKNLFKGKGQGKNVKITK